MTKAKEDIPIGNLRKIDIDSLMFEYFVSDIGIVYKYRRGKFKQCKPFLCKDSGYSFVKLRLMTGNGLFRFTERSVAVLVLSYFVGNNKNVGVLFIDGDKNNCRLDNLKYKTINNATSLPVGNISEIIEPDIRRGYFVSDFGLIYEFHNGFYYELCYKKDSRHGHKVVKLRTKTKQQNKSGWVSCLVARFVIKYFTGGYVRHRCISYIDGNRQNCRKENLKWKWGFDGVIDAEYCKDAILNYRMDKYSILATKYLLTKNTTLLYDIFVGNKTILKKMSYKYGVPSYYDDLIQDTFINLLKVMDDGRWRPESDFSVMAIIHKIFRHNSFSVRKYINANSINRPFSEDGDDYTISELLMLFVFTTMIMTDRCLLRKCKLFYPLFGYD